MRFLNKKGISPLIATVLLIGFTVALAGVVITWGGGFVRSVTSGTEEQSEATLACLNVDFEITKVVCNNLVANNNEAEITVDNKGSEAIIDLNLRFFDSAGNFKGTSNNHKEIEHAVGAFQVKKLMETTLAAEVSKVEALPRIKPGAQNVTCSDAVRVKEFDPCP